MSKTISAQDICLRLEIVQHWKKQKQEKQKRGRESEDGAWSQGKKGKQDGDMN